MFLCYIVQICVVFITSAKYKANKEIRKSYTYTHTYKYIYRTYIYTYSTYHICIKEKKHVEVPNSDIQDVMGEKRHEERWKSDRDKSPG